MPRPYPPAATLYTDLLPLEILNKIVDDIPPDLIAHYGFSKLRDDIWGFCYPGRGREVWEPALRASGLGLMKDETVVGWKKWSELAMECATHAVTCKHPSCGITRIRENEKHMVWSMKTGVPLMDTVHVERKLKTSTVFAGIRYKKNSAFLSTLNNIPRNKWDAFMSDPMSIEGQPDLGTNDKLCNHPLMRRSFVTFPPVSSFETFQDPMMVFQNTTGLTVADVLKTILAGVKRMETRDWGVFFSDVDFAMCDDIGTTPIFPKPWPYSCIFDTLEDFRDCLRILRFQGFGYVNSEEHDSKIILLRWLWETQPLPEDYDGFVAMTQYCDYD